MAKILIVSAHPEPQSFSQALAATAAATLKELGHEVAVSDLYAMGFNPVSDRRNFTTTFDAGYLKQQQEEKYATEHGGFAPELDAEMRKVEECDLMIFSFPLWWFGMPAILKGWVDKVFAYERFYGRGRWYGTGSCRGKKAMVLMTTGGGEEAYREGGPHLSLETVLAPVHHGIFWFNGFSPLKPFVAWSAAHGTDEDRKEVLRQWQARLGGLLEEEAQEMPGMAAAGA